MFGRRLEASCRASTFCSPGYQGPAATAQLPAPRNWLGTGAEGGRSVDRTIRAVRTGLLSSTVLNMIHATCAFPQCVLQLGANPRGAVLRRYMGIAHVSCNAVASLPYCDLLKCLRIVIRGVLIHGYTMLPLAEPLSVRSHSCRNRLLCP